jgi:hypothetical protein
MSAAGDPRQTQSLAGLRLDFPPSYVLVGVYRLSTDPSIRVPVWKKCKHGFIRGAVVGLAWVSTDDDGRRPRFLTFFQAFLTFGIQNGLIHLFFSK